MKPLDPEPRPSSAHAPPAPPPAELLYPGAPMVDFLQRRLEALEKDLERERENARKSQGELAHQEALRSEVESQMRAISDQIKREKAERESDEAKSHARGRIDELEKRLDEMHRSWADLLKEAMAKRQAGDTAIAAVKETIKGLAEQLNRQAPPPLAKDELISVLERERAELLRSLKDREERLLAVMRERETLEQTWAEKTAQLQERLSLALNRQANDATTISELRLQMASLTDHINRALKERDQALERAGSWEHERKRLTDIVKEKDEMLTLLNSTFQDLLKKP